MLAAEEEKGLREGNRALRLLYAPPNPTTKAVVKRQAGADCPMMTCAAASADKAGAPLGTTSMQRVHEFLIKPAEIRTISEKITPPSWYSIRWKVPAARQLPMPYVAWRDCQAGKMIDKFRLDQR